MTLYAYPKAVHVRRLKPGPFANYHTYKPYLRDEFARQCVYCRRHDGPTGDVIFGADHYRPKQTFPNLTTVYSNLFYCCNPCNSWKGTYWPDLADARAKRFIPNPCDHKMYEHLRYKGETVESRSPAGTHTVSLLHLDDPDEESYRAAVIATVEELTQNESGYKKTIAELMTLKTQVDPQLGAEITTEIVRLNQRLKNVQTALSIYR